MDDNLQQAIAAFQSGKRAEARRLLIGLVKQDPDSEAGWGWLFNVCDTDNERIDCLNQIVRINPQNEKANQLLQKYTVPEQSPSEQPVVEEQPDKDFENDVPARKVIRFLVIFQASVLVSGAILTLFRLSSIALFSAIVSVLVLLGFLLWFYIRYQFYPIIQEKRKLAIQSKRLQEQILERSEYITLAQQNRERIKQDEQAELAAALEGIQKKHIEAGLLKAHIADANLEKIGPELKQRLVTYGFLTAASITEEVKNLEGFNPAKVQALLDWQGKIRSYYDANKPKELPAEMRDQIINKYQVHHVKNNAEEHKAQEAKNKLEKNSQAIQPRVNTLTPFTFAAYLRYALGPRGVVAVGKGAGLILSWIALAAIAIYGAMAAR